AEGTGARSGLAFGAGGGGGAGGAVLGAEGGGAAAAGGTDAGSAFGGSGAPAGGPASSPLPSFRSSIVDPPPGIARAFFHKRARCATRAPLEPRSALSDQAYAVTLLPATLILSILS